MSSIVLFTLFNRIKADIDFLNMDDAQRLLKYEISKLASYLEKAWEIISHNKLNTCRSSFE